jgi:hypothetical protein
VCCCLSLCACPCMHWCLCFALEHTILHTTWLASPAHVSCLRRWCCSLSLHTPLSYHSRVKHTPPSYHVSLVCGGCLRAFFCRRETEKREHRGSTHPHTHQHPRHRLCAPNNIATHTHTHNTQVHRHIKASKSLPLAFFFHSCLCLPSASRAWVYL